MMMSLVAGLTARESALSFGCWVRKSCKLLKKENDRFLTQFHHCMQLAGKLYTVHCVEERGVLVNFQLPVTNFLVKEIIKIYLYFYPWLNSAFVQRCKKKQYLTYVHFPEGFQGIWFYWMKQDIWKGKIHGVI